MLLFCRLWLLIFAVTTVGCSANKKSDRDRRRDEIRVNADYKRQELAQVAGVYDGTLLSAEGADKKVSLKLEVKDEPQDLGEEVDAVLVPTLSGSLSIEYASQAGSVQASFAVVRAEFDANTSHLDLMLENSDFKTLGFDLKKDGSSFAGKWVAADSSLAGEAKFTRSGDKPKDIGDTAGFEENDVPLEGSNSQQDILAGQYVGKLYDQSTQSFRLADLIITTSLRKPDSFAVHGTLYLYVGAERNQEYVTFHYKNILMNPLDSQLSLASDESNVSLIGTFADGTFVGSWESSLTGDFGSAEFSIDQNAPGVVPNTTEN